ncbi:hypothetical protein HP550_20430 [Cellulomonas humilata]|uniref:Peptidase n=1 Tax=Cellulomonas humilata TaxID=144055 RepID=A0A7Y6A4K1_9CELL|nr:membrane dipeptidase [Cellulomonas humilata]NUU19617.1 hypothetical protein [Cellulomonas humilata]
MGDILGNVARTMITKQPWSAVAGHLVGGYPQFDGWPRWDSITHQSVHEDWLRRAVDGGLRVLVMLAVNNEPLCELANKEPGRTCDDMEAVDLQLAAARAMEADIDRRSGGQGRGWYRIVETPQEAREVAESGNLAVVLGIEVDYMFGARPDAKISEPQLEQRLDRYYAAGVRHIFPVHFGDNAFGGTAFSLDLQGNADDVPAWWKAAGFKTIFPPFPVKLEASTEYTYRGSVRNVRGLTPLGATLVRMVIDRGMLIDVDHMSQRTRADTLAICENVGYPVISGHTGFVEISGSEKAHEGNLLASEVERIQALGGLVCPIVHQGSSLDDVRTWRGGRHTVEHTQPDTSNTFLQGYSYAQTYGRGAGVGIGTDMNGFAGLLRPRFGPEGAKPAAGMAPEMTYPFIALATGKEMGRSVVGQKVFDLNTDGLAHIGMLPDLIADLENQGLDQEDLAPLMGSAEQYVQVWERAVGVRPRATHAGTPAAGAVLLDASPIASTPQFDDVGIAGIVDLPLL